MVRREVEAESTCWAAGEFASTACLIASWGRFGQHEAQEE